MNGLAAEAPKAKESRVSVTGTPTVLLFDDDDLTLLTLHAILERVTPNVIECDQERCVVESCERPETVIDLAIADVVLPVSNGPAVVRKIIPLQPRMRLLFISGFSLSELGKRGLLSKADLRPGFVEFLQKPFPASTFLSKVEMLLAQTT